MSKIKTTTIYYSLWQLVLMLVSCVTDSTTGGNYRESVVKTKNRQAIGTVNVFMIREKKYLNI
ncbi:uncharacterized protein METZ01_LOCUS276316 [marine metagenome]|uniref:Lipoprotein n=1 Tax=marine metagenome TaxID=408172 RepID=A0A382KJE7_9ZZZZ